MPAILERHSEQTPSSSKAIRNLTTVFNQRWKPYKYTDQPAINNPQVKLLTQDQISQLFPQPDIEQNTQIASQPAFKEIQMAPGLGRKPLYRLEGMNFAREERRFYKGYNQAKQNGKSHQEALELALSEKEANIRTWLREYVQQGTVLPMLITQGEENGHKVIVNIYDQSEKIAKKITTEERNGAVLTASIQADGFLDQLKGDGMIVINSPKGWTGYEVNGKPYNYLDNQTLVFSRRNGILEGVTLASDLSIEESWQLSKSLGAGLKDSEDLSIKEVITDIVSNTIFLPKGSSRFNTPEDIVDLITSFRPDGQFHFEQQDGTILTVATDDMKKDIRMRDQLLKFSQNVEEQIMGLRMFIRAESVRDKLASYTTQQRIAMETNLAMVKMAGKIIIEEAEKRGEELPTKKPGSSSSNSSLSPRGKPNEDFKNNSDGYGWVVDILKNRAGCNSTLDEEIVGGLNIKAGVEIKNPLDAIAEMFSWSGNLRRGTFGGINSEKQCLKCDGKILCGSKCYKCD